MSSSVVDMRGDLGDAAQQRRLVLVPAVLAPQLKTLSGSDDHDLLLQARVIAEEARNHDSPRGVEVRVLGAAVEEALELGQSRRQRRQIGERAAAVALVLLRMPNADAGL